MIKICAISDLHGYLPSIEESEILLIAGDISPLNIQGNKPAMKDWLNTIFADWINSLPVQKVYLTPGNHDFFFEGIAQYQLAEFRKATNYQLILLQNELSSYRCDDGERISIFGTPYCHIFGNWPFMCTPEVLEEKFKEIPDDIDIIISHDAPYGIGYQDMCWNKLQHIGNPELTHRLSEINYKWLFHGHLHTSNHTPESFHNGMIVNVSLLDEGYYPIFEPFYLNY